MPLKIRTGFLCIVRAKECSIIRIALASGGYRKTFLFCPNCKINVIYTPPPSTAAATATLEKRAKLVPKATYLFVKRII